MKNGIVYVITGEGKGKTTAAIGSAIRASGWGKKVLIIQFCKPEDFPTGEQIALKDFSNVVVKQFGTSALWGKGMPTFAKGEAAKEQVKKAFEYVQENSKKYDFIVLDEIFYALSDELLSEDALLDFLKTKPLSLNVILTGRGAPAQILETADIASEIRVIKYKREQRNIKGIDY